MESLIGQSIGRYEILEALGEGGMAIVFKAFDTRLERNVAVKFIRTEKLSSSIAVKRFELEAKAVANLNHPNIVKVLDYGDHQGTPYLVMEFVPGGTLKARMEERDGEPMHWQNAAKLLEPIASALAYAHQQNIIHRDIKPSNIIFSEDNRPMLSDFGVAKILEFDETIDLTGPGVGIGTPWYMSPEQGQGIKEVDHRSDIYSLGIVFYEMITGRKPYKADTPMAVIFQHIHQPLPNPHKYCPSLPRSVDPILYKTLAKNPQNRYQSMEDLAGAFKDLSQGKKTWGIGFLLRPGMGKFYVRLGIGLVTFLMVATTFLLLRIRNITDEGSIISPNLQSSEVGFNVAISDLANTRQVIEQSDEGIRAKSIEQTSQPNQGIQITQTEEITIPPTSTPTDKPIETLTPSPTSEPTPTNTPGIGSTFLSQKDGMTLVFVPEGEFLMGSNAYDSESPQHSVFLDAFWIDQTEVTNAMFAAFVNATRYVTDAEQRGNSATQNPYGSWENKTIGANWMQPTGPGDSIQGMDLYPVVQMSRNDALAYCQWAGRRLPTEAEWEKAARGVDGQLYPWGNSGLGGNLLNFCDRNCPFSWANQNFDDGYLIAAPVGTYPAGASPYGILDMLGNVWEWVSDWFTPEYSLSAIQNPKGPPSGFYGVIRGHGWISMDRDIRITFRTKEVPEESTNTIGFRCAMSAIMK